MYKEITCPYCGHEYDLCHDDGAFYKEDEAEIEECPQCDKKYLVTGSCSWSWEGEKADCLNDGNHTWKKTYPERYFQEQPDLAKRETCTDCGQRRRIE